MDYDAGQGWHDPRIVPYGPIEMEPSAMCLHYGQSVFEGMKAYRAVDGRILLFRPEKNMARLNVSNDRLCIPATTRSLPRKPLRSLSPLSATDSERRRDVSLYPPVHHRPDPHIGVHPASHLLFLVICCPVGAIIPKA